MATPNPDASKAEAPQLDTVQLETVQLETVQLETVQSDEPQPVPSKPEPPATSATTLDVPSFGWSSYAERINGRFAMVGFAAILVIEATSGDTFLHWAGLVP